MSDPSGQASRFLNVSGQNMAAMFEGARGQLTNMAQDALRTQILNQGMVRPPAMGASELMGQPSTVYMTNVGGQMQPVRIAFRPSGGQPSHQHHHHHQHQVPHQHQHDEQDTVIDLGTFLAESSGPPTSSPSDSSIGGGASQSGAATQLGDLAGLQGQAFAVLKTVFKTVEDFLPFVLLVFAKVMYDHRLGILVFIGLFGTFHHVNNKLCKLATRRDNTNTKEHAENVAWLIFFLALNIFAIYYFFSDQQLYKALYFTSPYFDEISLWTLLWITGTTDYVVKFSTVLLKTLIVALPRFCLPYSHKGRYHMLLETLSQLYRSLLPILPWFYFITDNKHGGQWFSSLLFLLYAIAKFFHLLKKARELMAALTKFRMHFSYGSVADRSMLESYDNICPICQDKFTDPVVLNCKHVFCEECVAMWFDRDRTCPMCRTAITDDPRWRDGSTWGGFQIY